MYFYFKKGWCGNSISKLIKVSKSFEVIDFADLLNN